MLLAVPWASPLQGCLCPPVSSRPLKVFPHIEGKSRAAAAVATGAAAATAAGAAAGAAAPAAAAATAAAAAAAAAAAGGAACAAAAVALYCCWAEKLTGRKGSFIVRPAACIVPPHRSSQLTVTWRDSPGRGVSREVLEALVYPSAQRCHQSVSPESVAVPQLLQLRVSGVHADAARTPALPPELAAAVSLAEQTIRMRPCAVGQMVWREVELFNRAAVCLDYEVTSTREIEEDLKAGRATEDLRVWPSEGRLPPEGLQHLLLLLRPSASSAAGQQQLGFRVCVKETASGSVVCTLPLSVFFCVERPNIVVDEDPVLFSVVGVGFSSWRPLRVLNLSGLPLKVFLQLQQQLQLQPQQQTEVKQKRQKEGETLEEERTEQQTNKEVTAFAIAANDTQRDPPGQDPATQTPAAAPAGVAAVAAAAALAAVVAAAGAEETEFVLEGHESKEIGLLFRPKAANAFEGRLLLRAELQADPTLLHLSRKTELVRTPQDVPRVADKPESQAAAAAGSAAATLDVAKEKRKLLASSSSSSCCCCCSRSVLLLGSGITCELEVEKSRLDLGPLTLTVTNPTAAPVHFEVDCRPVSSPPPAPSSSSSSPSSSSSSPFPSSSSSSSAAAAAATAEETVEEQQAALVEVYRQPKVLHSRCSSQLKIALTPLLAGPFCFQVRLLPLPSGPQPGAPGAPGAPQAGSSSQQDKLTRLSDQSDSRRVFFVKARDRRTAAHSHKQTPVLAAFLVEGEGVCPFVQFSDVRFLSDPQESPFSSWEHFQADQINQHFLAPPSQADEAFAAAEGLRKRRAALEALPLLRCFCGFFVLDKPQAQTSILLTLFNSGRARADDPEVEAAVLTPAALSLAPGGTRQVLLQLRHRSRGCLEGGGGAAAAAAATEEAEVVLQVACGRTLRLALMSAGVHSHAPFLYCPQLVSWEATPIGRYEGCWQTFALQNKGGRGARWRIPSSVFLEAMKKNGGRQLLQVKQAEGMLPAYSEVYVPVCLYPTRVEDYFVPMLVQYAKAAEEEGGETQWEEGQFNTLAFCLSFSGCTDTSTPPSRSSKFQDSPAPPHAAVFLPLTAKLTLERIAIHPRPFRCVEWRLTSLTNANATSALLFEWEKPQEIQHLLRVSLSPQKGVLQPGQSALIWISVFLPPREVKLKCLFRCQLTWNCLSPPPIPTGDLPSDSAAAVAAAAGSSSSSSKKRRLRRLTATSAAKLCSPQLQEQVQREVVDCMQQAAAHARGLPQPTGASRALKAEEGGPQGGPHGGPPWGPSPGKTTAAAVPEGPLLSEGGMLAEGGKLHAMRGPLVLLLEASTSQQLEARMQVTHRAPPPSPYIQWPADGGPPMQALQEGGPPSRKGSSHTAPQEAPQGPSSQQGPLLPPSALSEERVEGPLVDLQGGPPFQGGGPAPPPELVGQTAVCLLTLMLSDLLAAKQTEELLDDLIGEDPIAATRLFPATCTYTRNRQTHNSQQQLQQEQHAAAAATAARAAAAPALFHANDFFLWSPLAGHFQSVQTNALQRPHQQPPPPSETAAAAAGGAAEAKAALAAAAAAAGKGEEAGVFPAFKLMHTDAAWAAEWLPAVSSSLLLQLLRQLVNEVFEGGLEALDT
ncbi:hypothetical protein Efla_002174 [Eimeria flavescens]